MPRYAAFLRGVSPTNAQMPALKRAFEAAGFDGVRTVLSSGNVVFGARKAAAATLERSAEAAMQAELGKVFRASVRPIDHLVALLATDPYARFEPAAGSKRVVTFLRQAPPASLVLPVELDGARILHVQGHEAFTVYVPGSKGPVFMTLIERTFGRDVTTRTWDTLGKVAAAGTS